MDAQCGVYIKFIHLYGGYHGKQRQKGNQNHVALWEILWQQLCGWLRLLESARQRQ